ncbi:DUF3618 domain-containing protein [Actinoplanes teichomyceticus]|uniref:Uncharacterized protein DUF3618 n=1 Tax=Actinoplanes teichomyceticus TaxID=1867 RepID=A0A561VCT1_ACTTI|nr:DUF3618 domain-containing protein [Actinoplanes teichomyceticus]TWG09221.1 uncharacterized protein DUF3618 [Actinoplanes teichomyceticus]TWG09413.1 uncharacterized protein DUF3618 [Actinoplanes teichomyceticus]GIF17268.1 hypothetical protein Ate01nite_73000 [Actinoplanes teichomyceticus]
MAEEPDQLRRRIEQTRASLTRDVDLLAEKTSPGRVAKRRWTAVKEKVMGSTEHARYVAADTTSSAVSAVQDRASSAAGTVQEKAGRFGDAASAKAHDAVGAVRGAPQAVATQTQGNPLAAGIIAFGVGLLASSLLPVTEAERRAGAQLKEHSGDLVDGVKDVAGELKDELSGSVEHAVTQVKETARDAAQTAKDQAKTSAHEATDQTRNAAHHAS